MFCIHYFADAGIEDEDCEAFAEIPEEIFECGDRHTAPVSGDGGVRFELNPEMREEYFEVEALREEILRSNASL